MARRATSIVGWTNVAVTLGLGFGGTLLTLAASSHVTLPDTLRIGRFEELSGLSVAAFALVGALIVSRQPRNWVGWICCTIALSNALTSATQGYVAYGLYYRPGLLPATLAFAWFRSWIWLPAFELEVFFLPLLFPTGSLPSPRWRYLAWVAGLVSIAGPLAFGTDPSALVEYHLRNPAAVLPGGVVQALQSGYLVGLLVGLLLASASLAVRFRHGSDTVRDQIKWFTAAVVFTIAVVGTGLVVGLSHGNPNAYRLPVFDVLWPLGLTAIPVSVGMAILKYRLYDIDLVINRALLYGALAALITAIYMLLVVGIGTLIGSGGRLNLVLSIVATAVVAVAFQPLREALTRLANRVVYGRRAVPYEVLAEFSKRTAAAGSPEQLPARMVRVLAEAMGAASAAVWLRVGDELRVAAAFPEPAGSAEPVPLVDEGLPDLGAQAAEPVRHQGELLGALTVTKARGGEVVGIERRLLSDLAAQAALALRNLRLTAELMERLDELRASRQRLVTAQDDERRRIERDLHDGAQQQLVALKVKLGLARALASRDAEKTRALLDELVGEADESLQTLRNLAHGIYPPLLMDAGLVAALEAQARRAPTPVTVKQSNLGRYAPDVEAAVYFCCLEALQNAGKYAQASRVTVDLIDRDGRLRFSVADDGLGYDPHTARHGAGLQNMTDRLEALGGSLEVESAPGHGTTVNGWVPARLPAGPEAPRPATAPAGSGADRAEASIRPTPDDSAQPESGHSREGAPAGAAERLYGNR